MKTRQIPLFLLLIPPFLIIFKETDSVFLSLPFFRSFKKLASLRSQNYQKLYRNYRFRIDRRLASLIDGKSPSSVYDPIRYVLASGGKRVRSMLVLLSCQALGGKMSQALDAAAAIEILHNFTLVHDDVMDKAVLRRGRPTVHKKWDTNVAILAGDEMIAHAYRSLLKTKTPRMQQVLSSFTDAFVQVCEGQGLDKEFERRGNVGLEDYLLMIDKKTGRVISAAAEIGAIIGGGSAAQISALRKFGEYLGRAFQIQDDLLDIDGNEKDLGKTIGGDIMEGKKTYLLLKALETVNGSDRTFLRSLTSGNGVTKAAIRRVQHIYRNAGVLQETETEVAGSTKRAQQSIAHIKQSRSKEMLVWLSDQLLQRNS